TPPRPPERSRPAGGGGRRAAPGGAGGPPPPPPFLRLVAEGQVDVTSLVSHVVPAADAADAYVLLDERPAEALQVVLEF
ncbi:hypothetical protein ACFV05_32295, partial [Streptomyces pseudogriseolus]